MWSERLKFVKSCKVVVKFCCYEVMSNKESNIKCGQNCECKICREANTNKPQSLGYRGAMFMQSDKCCYLPMLLSIVLAPEAGVCDAPERKMQSYDKGHHSQHLELVCAASSRSQTY